MARFDPSYEGIGEMLRSPWMIEEMRKRAEKVKAAAEAIAPDAPPYGVGYVRSFEVEAGVRHAKTTRAYAIVRNTSDHSIYVEYGSKNNPKHRTLGRALDSAK